MPATTDYSRGDVILVGFVFPDESGRKRRPCTVISSPLYQQNRQDVIVAAITTNTRRRLFGDHLIGDWQGAGLRFPSVATGVIRTIKQAMIDRKLGSLPGPDMGAIDQKLRRSLDF